MCLNLNYLNNLKLKSYIENKSAEKLMKTTIKKTNLNLIRYKLNQKNNNQIS